VLARGFETQLVHISIARLDQLQRPLEQLFKVVAGVADFCPVVAKPFNIILNGADELIALLLRIGIVEAKVAEPAKFFGDVEAQANRLGVPDLQVAVGLWGEACLHPPTMLTSSHICGYSLADKIIRAVLAFWHKC
jgi:hypothetical protein